MNTYLGVAGELAADDIDEALVASARITYVEGYLVGLPSAEGALAAAADAAHRAGRRVALTLSDSFWVQLQRDAFNALLPTVDILLGNEAEALEITGEPDLEAALRSLTKTCPVVALTRGAAGAIASDGNETVSVPAEIVGVEDTTGAGDLFAAGFLLGLARERGLGDCLRLGALAAAEVIGHTGARPQTSLAALAASHGSASPGTPPDPRVMMPDWKVLGDEAIEITRQYLRIDTTNPPGNETPAAEFLAAIFAEAGLETTLLESAPGRGNLIARLPGRARDPAERCACSTTSTSCPPTRPNGPSIRSALRSATGTSGAAAPST